MNSMKNKLFIAVMLICLGPLPSSSGLSQTVLPTAEQHKAQFEGPNEIYPEESINLTINYLHPGYNYTILIYGIPQWFINNSYTENNTYAVFNYTLQFRLGYESNFITFTLMENTSYIDYKIITVGPVKDIIGGEPYSGIIYQNNPQTLTIGIIIGLLIAIVLLLFLVLLDYIIHIIIIKTKNKNIKPKINTNYVYCLQCKQSNDKDAKYCDNCGGKI